MRQNRKGQRVAAHAAAAGGAVRSAPGLMLAMHASAIEQGSAALAAELADAEAAAEADGKAAAKLRCAVAYCCALRDTSGGRRCTTRRARATSASCSGRCVSTHAPRAAWTS